MDFEYLKHRNIESKITHMKYDLPYSTNKPNNTNINNFHNNNNSNTEYLKHVNSQIGAGSILKCKTVTSGYSVHPFNYHMVDSDMKYCYDIEVSYVNILIY